MVIQLRALTECLWRSFLRAAAKITRQELSPKVLLIAGKSHLVPQWESILRLEALLSHFNSFWNVHFDRHLQARTDCCDSQLAYNALTYLCFITVTVVLTVIRAKVKFADRERMRFFFILKGKKIYMFVCKCVVYVCLMKKKVAVIVPFTCSGAADYVNSEL